MEKKTADMYKGITSEEVRPKKSLRRIAIYLNYFPNGIVRRHSLYYLSALVRNCEQVLVVVNGDINDEGKSKILSLTPNLLIRKNEGFDIWGYKEGMEWFGWEFIRKCDELLLTNSTCYGPIYPLEETFSAMEQKPCDFWGLVKHPQQNNYLLPNHKGYINEHIMSYFTVIRRRMLQSDCFRKYWETLPMMRQKAEAVGLHEVVFTQYFEERGFKSDAYVDLTKYEGRVNNSSIFLADELLIEERCPMVKRRAFFFPNYQDLRGRMMTDHAARLYEFIRTQTDYDVAMIWEDLLANERYSQIRQNMHMVQVLQEAKASKEILNGKKICAVILAMDEANPRTYARLVGVLEEVGAQIDLYYTGERMKQELTRLNVMPNVHLSMTKIVASNGISRVLCCLQSSMEKLLNADYILAVLQINEADDALRIEKEEACRYIVENIAGSLEGVASILQMFESDPFMGMVSVLPCSFGRYFAMNQRLLTKRWNILKEFHSVCEFSFPFDEDVDVSDNAFWVNKKGMHSIAEMLKKISSCNKGKYLDHIMLKYMLPRFVQARGQYAMRIISNQSAAVELDNLRYDLQRINLELDRKGIRNWDAYGTIQSIRRFSDRNVVSISDRENIVHMPYRFREILQILAHYPKHKVKNILGAERAHALKERIVKRQSKPVTIIHGYASLMTITEENGRILFLLSSSDVDFNRCKLMCSKKKSYALKRLKQNQWDLIDYCRATGRYAAFFSVPVEWVRNSEISLMYEEGQIIGLQWVFAISYNALELKEKGLYFRIENKILYCYERNAFIQQVMKSKAYSIKEKLIFAFACVNPWHPLTIMAENLNAGDNTYQLFQYALQKKEPVYYVCSKKTHDSQRDCHVRTHMLVHNSRKHKLAMLFARRWIGSYSLRAELLPTVGVLKDIHYCMLPTQWIFVPHGMLLPDKTAFMCISYNWENPGQTYASSMAERDCYAGYYGFKNVYALGAPRMDKWAGVRNPNQDILFFFTWRQSWSRYGKKMLRETFEASAYFRIAVNAVKTVRQTYPDRKIGYVFHHEVERCGFDQVIRSALAGQNVDFISFSDTDGEKRFNEAFRGARYLVTDFSSVAYDFSYKQDGIAIYYQPSQFIIGHYEVDQAQFEKIHLGVVAQTQDDLISCLNMTQRTDEMKKRRERFFPDLNGGNTQRVYEAVFHPQKKEQPSQPINEQPTKLHFRRLCIYFFYDEQGVVDRYVIHYLKEIRKSCSEICVVVNGKLNAEGQSAFERISDVLIIRENVGFDSSAYKDAILHYGYEYIANNYDELILNNFTNYGPIYPFEEMFAFMDKRDCDLWGNAYYSAVGNKIGGILVPEHLMSYFIVFRSSILKSEAFKQYWQTLKIADNYQEAILFHETRCMEYFMRKGFVADSFISREKYFCRDNIAVWMAYRLLTEDRNPLLKRKVFMMNKDGFCFKLMDGHDACEAMQYLVEHTSYDPMLIMENVGRMSVGEGKMTVAQYAAAHEDFVFNDLMKIILNNKTKRR